MSPSKLLICTLLIFLLAITTAYADNRLPQMRFTHQPPTVAVANAPFSLKVKISDQLRSNQVRCYFRYKQGVNPVYVTPLPGLTDTYHFLLPAPEEHIKSIQYCYLAQNSKQQLIRSPWYEVRVILDPEQQNSPAKRLNVSTDLLLPDDPTRSGGGTAAVVQQEEELLWLGMAAGIYRPEDFPGVAVATGFFGGFTRADGAEAPEAVEGFFPLHLPGEQPVRSLPEPGQSVPEPLAKDRTETDHAFAGPLVDGADWSGRYYIWPFGEDLQAISASITQLPFSSVADIIEVTTSLHGKGHHMTGTLSNTGRVKLTDSYDGDQWTTHNEPAELSTSSHFHCEDYVGAPADKDTHRIDLDRPTEPEPEPEPQPDASLLTGVLQLLL